MPLEIECLQFPSGNLFGRIVSPPFFSVNEKEQNTKTILRICDVYEIRIRQIKQNKPPSNLNRQRDALRLLSATANAPTPHRSGKNAIPHGLSRVPDLQQ
jgi:hypothetical protein